MLTLLRRMRRSLIESNSTRKYLLYAAGEVLLVMIGILLALQVNNCNEYRKERITEERILHNITENLELNIEKLEDEIQTLLRCDRSSEIVLEALLEQQPYHDSLETHFGWGLTIEHIGTLPSMGYEALKNVGIEIIRNKPLQKEIIYLFEMTYSDTHSRIQRIVPFNIETVQLRQENFLRTTGFSFQPFNYMELQNDRYFISWLKTIKNNRQWVRRSLEDSLEESRRVLDLIKKELGQS